MLSLITGPNGSGKTLYALHQIVQELLKGQRYIVTSIAIDLPALSQYLSHKYQNNPVDVFARVYKLQNLEQMRQFWRYTGPFTWTEYGIEANDLGNYGGPKWQAFVPPTLYVLEELQVTFNSREWGKTAREFTDFQTQHRHFGHDVLGLTPALSLIEKQFRVLCGECVVLKNLYQSRVGIWKHSRKINYRVFSNAPPMPGEIPSFTGDMFIDAKGLAGCYDTSGGIGHAGGRSADKGKESGGIPWKYGVLGALLLAFLIWFGLTRGMHALNKQSAKGYLKHATGTPQNQPPPRPDQDAVQAQHQQNQTKPGLATIDTKAEMPLIIGWGAIGYNGHAPASWRVNTDQGYGYATSVIPVMDGVLIDGTKYARKTPARPSQAVTNRFSGPAPGRIRIQP